MAESKIVEFRGKQVKSIDITPSPEGYVSILFVIMENSGCAKCRIHAEDMIRALAIIGQGGTDQRPDDHDDHDTWFAIDYEE